MRARINSRLFADAQNCSARRQRAARHHEAHRGASHVLGGAVKGGGAYACIKCRACCAFTGVLTPVCERAQEQPQGAAELLKRQEELEKKAAELDRREREMQTLSASGGDRSIAEAGMVQRPDPSASGQLSSVSGRKNNWPPLPECFPVGPCFYHDITVDIPVEFQKTVQIMYYLWMCEWLLLSSSGMRK